MKRIESKLSRLSGILRHVCTQNYIYMLTIQTVDGMMNQLVFNTTFTSIQTDIPWNCLGMDRIQSLSNLFPFFLVLSLSCTSLCLAEIKLNLIRVQYPFNISPGRAFTVICLFVFVSYAWFTSLQILLSLNIVIYKRICIMATFYPHGEIVLSPNGVTDLFQQVWVYILCLYPWRSSSYIFSPLVALKGALILGTI